MKGGAVRGRAVVILIISALTFAFSFQALTMRVNAQLTPIISVQPPTLWTRPDTSFSVDVIVSDVLNLYGYQFTLRYNTTVLTATGMAPHMGTVNEPGFFHPTYLIWQHVIDDDPWGNGTGRVFIAITPPIGTTEGRSGSGVLARITFDATALGRTALTLNNDRLVRPDATNIPHTTVEGVVTVGASRFPVADPNGPYAGWVNVPLIFDGSGSTDPDGYIVAWDWDFGDGSMVSEMIVGHTYGSAGSFVVNLTVTDNDGLTNSTLTTAEITVDGTPPMGSVVIDGDSQYTNSMFVTLALSASDAESGVDQMRFSHDNVAWTNWEGYFTSRAWTLTSGDGQKTVYVQYRDKVGLESVVYHDTIMLDATVPSGSIRINNDATYTASTSVTLFLTAADSTSGVSGVRYSNDGVWDSEPWEDFSATRAWALTAGDGEKAVHYQIMDNSGLLSNTYSDSIILDTDPPTGSVTINGGATYTNSTSVTLTLNADDGISGVAQMHFSNDNTAWTSWEPYSTFKLWTLTTGDGEKTVYVQFMDTAGSASSVYHDYIMLDTAKPVPQFTFSPSKPLVDEVVTFDASASTDNTGIVGYEWDLGDGTHESGVLAKHAYAHWGPYTIGLTVWDAAGNADSITATIDVGTILSIKLSGEFDYLLRENVRIRIVTLVRDALTMTPISNAQVKIEIYDDVNNLWISSTMVEKLARTGIYEWTSSGTIRDLGLKKGVYLVRVEASFSVGPKAYDIMLFHIDPPTEDIYETLGYVAFAVAATFALTVIILRKRKSPKSPVTGKHN